MGRNGKYDATLNCRVNREDFAVSRQLTQAHVQRFDGIGRVDDLADFAWELEKWDDIIPVCLATAG